MIDTSIHNVKRVTLGDRHTLPSGTYIRTMVFQLANGGTVQLNLFAETQRELEVISVDENITSHY
jgi:hypothetical protein